MADRRRAKVRGGRRIRRRALRGWASFFVQGAPAGSALVPAEPGRRMRVFLPGEAPRRGSVVELVPMGVINAP